LMKKTSLLSTWSSITTHQYKNWLGILATTGLTHIALTVNDLKNRAVKLKENEWMLVSDFKSSPNRLVNVVLVKGPESLMLDHVEPITTLYLLQLTNLIL